MPDRSGYGQSAAIDALPSDFHRRAADETRAVIEGLGLERPVLWGHSDGAIIALLLARARPGRCGA
jgi:pimeloyl-ACP methyl ester carboxylesterase